jgi:RHS repeat-associated protein
VAALTGAAGTIIESYRYDAYGQPSILDGLGAPVPPDAWGVPHSAAANPWLFTGRQFDEEAGLFFYRARYYDAGKGRFVQRDPFEYVDGMNLYEYATSAPTKFTDASGMVCCGQINLKSLCSLGEGCTRGQECAWVPAAGIPGSTGDYLGQCGCRAKPQKTGESVMCSLFKLTESGMKMAKLADDTTKFVKLTGDLAGATGNIMGILGQMSRNGRPAGSSGVVGPSQETIDKVEDVGKDIGLSIGLHKLLGLWGILVDACTMKSAGRGSEAGDTPGSRP